MLKRSKSKPPLIRPKSNKKVDILSWRIFSRILSNMLPFLRIFTENIWTHLSLFTGPRRGLNNSFTNCVVLMKQTCSAFTFPESSRGKIQQFRLYKSLLLEAPAVAR